MKILQVGFYDLLLTIGLIVSGLSALLFILHNGGQNDQALPFTGLLSSLLLFLISWVTLSLFTRDMAGSAVASARTDGVCFGLLMVTFAVLVELSRSRFWPMALFATEIVLVSMGMSYLHVLSTKRGIVSGLIISAALIALTLIIIR